MVVVFGGSGYRMEICEILGCVVVIYSILNYFDKNVDLCDDFYNFVCGNWFKSSFILVGYLKWIVFYWVLDNNLIILKKFFENK